MPELPEVQTTASSLNKLIKGLTIKDAWTDYKSAFHEGKDNIKNSKYFPVFRNAILNKKILAVNRRAKNVLIHLSGNITILVHMKMTGHLLYGKYIGKQSTWKPAEEGPLNDPFNRFIHLVISLSNGKHLALSDMRKFAKVCLIDSVKLEESAELAHLGPEPLQKSFSFGIFKNRLLLRPNGKIKQVLMDQTVIAGIGNIYSDEALWLSGINPLTKVIDLESKELLTLFKYTRLVLKKGIHFGGDSMSDYRAPNGMLGKYQLHHKAYGRKGQRCPKRNCGGIIERVKIGGRSAHFCSCHQKINT